MMLNQPPLGGCVLKLCGYDDIQSLGPAAFRRLCVETRLRWGRSGRHRPAAFRRLCVETFVKKLGMRL